jgi:papain like protease
MLGLFLHRLRWSGLRPASFALVGSLLIVLALSGTANAGNGPNPRGFPLVGGAPDTSTRSTPRAMPRSRALGALRPKRQVKVRLSKRQLAATLPASVDLFAWSVPIGNQDPYGQEIGSCVTWAIDYAMLGWYSNHDNKPGQPFNPMYTYSQVPHGADGQGSYPADVLNVAVTQGNDTMAHYSHPVTDYVDQPNAAEKANAANYRVRNSPAPLFVNTAVRTDGSIVGGGSIGVTAIKTALFQNKPVAIALAVRPGFDTMPNSTGTLDDDITGVYPRTGKVRGLHEVLALAYDQYGLWIQNSWDTNWGYNGYGRLSWQVVSNDVYQAHTIDGFATTVDTTPPVMGTVDQQFAVGQQMTSTTVPVQFNWSASDAVGISAYEVSWSTNNGASWTIDTNAPTTATSITRSLGIGYAYKYRVRARDAAGNWSGYSTSVSVTPSVTDEKLFALNSPWSRFSNLADSFGGTYAGTSSAGAWFQYTATGRDIALIAPKASNAGRATLYCDGTPHSLYDEYNATTVSRQVITWCHFSQSASHTIKLVVEGTAGRPSFFVDAFTVLS